MTGPQLHQGVHSELSQAPRGEGGSASRREGEPMGQLSDRSSAGQSQGRAEGVIWETVLRTLRISCAVWLDNSLPEPCGCKQVSKSVEVQPEKLYL